MKTWRREFPIMNSKSNKKLGKTRKYDDEPESTIWKRGKLFGRIGPFHVFSSVKIVETRSNLDSLIYLNRGTANKTR